MCNCAIKAGCVECSARKLPFMCLSPVSIKNPNLGMTGPNAQFKDCVSLRINVPCGVCAECVVSRQMQYVQRLQTEELVNHLFFCTLTYNNDMLPVVTTSTGFSIRFADVSDCQKMFKRLRKKKKNMKMDEGDL